ncbi:MAG: hypothetical protein KF773_01335 [Deltaproteobacteria bacterium]|nr:hypothetical protein [Deltaproteobacteria bacterium]
MTTRRRAAPKKKPSARPRAKAAKRTVKVGSTAKAASAGAKLRDATKRTAKPGGAAKRKAKPAARTDAARGTPKAAPAGAERHGAAKRKAKPAARTDTARGTPKAAPAGAKRHGTTKHDATSVTRTGDGARSTKAASAGAKPRGAAKRTAKASTGNAARARGTRQAPGGAAKRKAKASTGNAAGARGTRQASGAKHRGAAKPARRARPEPELTVEDTAQAAKQFAYVLTPVETAAAFALGSIIASRPPLAPAPPSARVQTPFAERAAGAGSCAQCDDAIARTAWQVVVTDDGATIHPGCAFAWMQEHLEDHDETEAWMSTLVERLSETDRAELLAALDRD